MDTNYHMLRLFEWHPQQYGICTAQEAKLIEDHFRIKERSAIELQNLRDFVVMYYATRIGQSNSDEERDALSAITYIIDDEKMRRGMEV